MAVTQVIPHVTNPTRNKRDQEPFYRSEDPSDQKEVAIIEIGGTVGRYRKSAILRGIKTVPA